MANFFSFGSESCLLSDSHDRVGLMWGLIHLAPSFIATIVICGAIALAERVWPGRELPPAPGWYWRAAIFNFSDIVVLTAVGLIFDEYFRTHAWLPIRQWNSIALQVLFVWPIWALVFYWWHRAVHMNGLWHLFHQMHHSPSRIEVLTTFYKHPLESIVETVLTAFLLYQVFGVSAEVGAWVGALVCMVGFYSHSNLRTPKWTGWFIQRPEQHSIHHQIDVHAHNYADFILWDRIFGTFKDAEDFTPRCGFPKDHERRVVEMLRFKDVYHEPPA
jgi:sterol desaturase/sphingolipid hydroxylase (fatty acid hydroxylase superfamily)